MPQRLDAHLAVLHPQHSRGVWAKHIKSGYVSIDNKTCTKPSQQVANGATVSVELPEKSPKRPVNVPIKYEDEDVLVINKPIGLLTHAKGGEDDEYTVEDFASDHVNEHTPRGGIVHRLDRDTSGVMVIAKHKESYEHIQQQFAERTVKKEYVALVHGNVPNEVALFDWPIERNPKKQHLFRVGPNGKESQTKMTIIEKFKKHTLVLLEPKTGRTHQLRVHMVQYEHPIVGDSFYGDKKQRADRLYLHAQSLTFATLGKPAQAFVSKPEWDLSGVTT